MDLIGGGVQQQVRRTRELRAIITTGLVGVVTMLTTVSGGIGSLSAAAATSLTRFSDHVSPIDAAQLGATWRPGCPVGPAQLRLVTLDYVNFQGEARVGTMVVASKVVGAVVTVFRTLYDHRFPIHSMVPESQFGGHDPTSMAADNTSGFNCRRAVASGPPQWSVHAYGEAIDVNPVQNPYVFNGVAQPAGGAAYMSRSTVRPGMAEPGGVLNDAFASVGWYWGGRWSASPDYQHFSATGG
jgi:hypothetical protein